MRNVAGLVVAAIVGALEVEILLGDPVSLGRDVVRQ